MVNYQGRYLSNLSSKSEPLRNLLVEKNEFVWGEQEENCFIELKNILSNEPVLKFYDPEKEIKTRRIVQNQDWEQYFYKNLIINGAQ